MTRFDVPPRTPAAWQHLTPTPTSASRALLLRLRSHVRRPRAVRGRRMDAPVDAPSIQTQRLTLRPHRLADAEQWFLLESDPRVVQYLPWPLRDRRSSLQHLRDRTRHTRLWQADDFLALAVELNGCLIGDVSLHLRSVDRDVRAVEVGWIIDPAFSGAGYATEAAAALLGFAFAELDAAWALARIDPRNTRSCALAHRLGFVEARGGTKTSGLSGSRGTAVGVDASGQPSLLPFILTSQAFRQRATLVSLPTRAAG